jgi:hypothetical protein
MHQYFQQVIVFDKDIELGFLLVEDRKDNVLAVAKENLFSQKFQVLIAHKDLKVYNILRENNLTEQILIKVQNQQIKYMVNLVVKIY